MYTNKIAALAGAVAVINQVTALNINRVAALNINRRENKVENKHDVVWKTVVKDVYVNEGAPTTGARPNDVGKVADDVVVVPAQAPKNEPPPVPKKQQKHAPARTSSKASVKPDTPTGGGSTGASSKKPGFPGKRGLAYNDPALANLVGASCKGKCGWAYNWGQVPGALEAVANFIPMLWGRGPNNANEDFFKSWHSSATEAVAKGAKALLSFNEPDKEKQANMTPAEAAKYHVEYMNPFSGQALIGAPAISNSNIPGEGLDWLRAWVNECTTQPQRCEFHICTAHWYDHTSAIDRLFEFLEQVHTICEGKDVWLTEFAPIEATTEQAADFLTRVIPKLDSLEYLDAYAYFMAGTGNLQLLSPESTLNAIGLKYVSS